MPTHILIIVEGGSVQDVITDLGIEILYDIVDLDTLGQDLSMVATDVPDVTLYRIQTFSNENTKERRR